MFKTSNGYTLDVGAGSIEVFNRAGETRHVLGKYSMDSLREFFQHERDEEHGLWRSPSDPTWTAVHRNTTIYFQNEDHERSFHFVPRLEASIKAWSHDLQALAYEYIEAHPERKPWHDAKPGEVWVVAEHGQPERAYLVDDSQFYDSSRDYALNFDDSLITSARRIWPESD